MVENEAAGQPEALADYACDTGENPLWHPDEKRVYWTDIPNGRLFRYDPRTGEHEVCYEGEPVGGFTVQADGNLLLFGARGAVRVWRDGLLKTILEDIPDERGSRFNDVIADPEGRVFCGTMPPSDGGRQGRLYRLDPDGTVTVVAEDVGCANGMGFTPDLTGMYFTDSSARTIYRFDYDRATGALSNRTVFATVPNAPGEGVPDGMTVDTEGNVWSARWDGWALVCYSPTGELLRRIPFPVKKVSSAVFGGDDCGTLYCTTAGGHQKETDGLYAGALFRLHLPGVCGVPEFRSRIGL